jgi:carboxyl-terminal processing protease
MTSTKKKASLALAILAFVFGAGVYAGIEKNLWNSEASAQTGSSTITFTLGADTQPSNVDMGQFWKAWNLLEQNYVPTHTSSTIPTTQARLYGAIEGLTNSYGDPYTVFMPPSDAQVFQQDISGEFDGVGMELGTKDNKLVVVAPLKGSPSEKAGVLSGDVVLAIDSKPTDGLAVDDAVKLIRGKKGTTVTLLIGRVGQSQPLSIPIVRDTINIPIVNNFKRSDGVYEIDLYSFSANSADLFRSALRDFFTSGSTKLLLDLRGNPGGYLEAAVDMASYFLPVGDVVVTEDFKGKQDNIVHRSLGYNVFQNKKLTMAILIDQGTASASEILSGALQQHGVAKLVGTRSFGKGSVQELLDLGGGAELKVTVARWLTPNGSSISDGGLTPDIQATTTQQDVATGKDPQKDAAIEYLFSN